MVITLVTNDISLRQLSKSETEVMIQSACPVTTHVVISLVQIYEWPRGWEFSFDTLRKTGRALGCGRTRCFGCCGALTLLCCVFVVGLCMLNTISWLCVFFLFVLTFSCFFLAKLMLLFWLLLLFAANFVVLLLFFFVTHVLSMFVFALYIGKISPYLRSVLFWCCCSWTFTQKISLFFYIFDIVFYTFLIPAFWRFLFVVGFFIFAASDLIHTIDQNGEVLMIIRFRLFCDFNQLMYWLFLQFCRRTFVSSASHPVIVPFRELFLLTVCLCITIPPVCYRIFRRPLQISSTQVVSHLFPSPSAQCVSSSSCSYSFCPFVAFLSVNPHHYTPTHTHLYIHTLKYPQITI